MNRTMPCLQMNKLYILGSWSQCMRKNERGLSMNRNSQTRMTNDQIRRNDEIRMTKPMTAQLRAFGHSGFGFLLEIWIASWSPCTRKSERRQTTSGEL